MMGFSGKIDLETFIVEDNATDRRFLRDSLQSLSPSMIIQEATEGIGALQRVDTLRPELVFMDIRLPGESGLQLTHTIEKKLSRYEGYPFDSLQRSRISGSHDSV